MYSCLRHNDRTWNLDVYPKLFFPDIYLMEGGYASFWQKFKHTPLIRKPQASLSSQDYKGEVGMKVNE
jgi:M-phase inducer tyrosine phosphatase